MKILTEISKLTSMALYCSIVLIACTSDPETTTDPQPEFPDLSTVEGLDSLSDQFIFINAKKVDGKAPSAPPEGSSLKFNIKDTLHLAPGIPILVKFLHDELTNVAGVYIQIRYFSSSASVHTFASHHYDVPEIPEASENDTLSVIIVGFDPGNVDDPTGVPPAGTPRFQITVTPYDPSGNPIEEAVVPVIVEDEKNDGGNCGLVLPPGEYWSWDQSWVIHPDFSLTSPNTPRQDI